MACAVSDVLYIEPQWQAEAHVERARRRVLQAQIFILPDFEPRIARLPRTARRQFLVDFLETVEQEAEMIEARR